MPFITEELWQGLKQRLPEGSLDSTSIMIAPYPVADEKAIDPEAEQVMDSVIEIIRCVRNARAEHKVAAGKWIEARVYADNLRPAIASQSQTIETLAKARPLAVLSRDQRQAKGEKALVLVLKEAEVVLPWAGMVDLVAERQRLEKEISASQGEITRLGQRLKDTANEMLEDLPRNMSGDISDLSGPLAKQLDNIINLEDTVTPNQMSKLLESFNSAVDDATLTPGVSGGAAKHLAKAADASFDDALTIGGDDAAKTLLSETRKEYGKRITEFNDAMVRRLTKPSSAGGAIDPEKAVDVLFRKGMHVKLRKMLNFASIETKQQLQDQAMDNIFKTFIKHGDDPFESIMNGTALRQSLDGYGETTLNVMFGKQKTKDLYRLAKVTQLATNKKVGAGAIAVAGVALRPLKNIGLLAKFRVLNKILRHPRAIKWLTVGLDAPKTRAGMASMTRFGTFVSLLAESDKSDLAGE